MKNDVQDWILRPKNPEARERKSAIQLMDGYTVNDSAWVIHPRAGIIESVVVEAINNRGWSFRSYLNGSTSNVYFYSRGDYEMVPKED